MAMDEIKKQIEEIGTKFEDFKAENDAALKKIKDNGHVDPLLAEKITKIQNDMNENVNMKKDLEKLEASVEKMKHLPGGGIQIDPVKAEHMRAFDSWARKGVEGDLAVLEIKAGLSVGSDPDGGFTVPIEEDPNIDRVAPVVSAMRSVAKVMTIGTDTYEKLVSQGGTASGWVGEKAARTATTGSTLAKIAINTKELYANVPATQKLLDDSRVDIPAWINSEIAVEFAEEEGDAFINGNGVEEPKGIDDYTKVANASYAWGKVGFIATGSASITSTDSIYDLRHALKSVYRQGASFLLNDATFLHVQKMKDGNGNYIWTPGLTLGAPDTLIGKEVVIEDNLADIGSATFPIYFGNWQRAYTIVDRFGIRVLRDPYTDKPNILFYTTKRVGGGVVMYEGLKALKCA